MDAFGDILYARNDAVHQSAEQLGIHNKYVIEDFMPKEA